MRRVLLWAAAAAFLISGAADAHHKPEHSGGPPAKECKGDCETVQPAPEPEPDPVTELEPEPQPAPEPVVETEQVFWIAPDGSDTNSCTFEQPCGTPHHAAAVAQPGDAWYFKAGLYKPGSRIEIANSGFPGAPITFSAAPGDERQAVIDGFGWFGQELSHIRIRGFKVQNLGSDAIRFECRPWTVCDDIRIVGNWTLNTKFSGIAVHGGLFQFGQIATDNVMDLVIDGNRIEKANSGGVTENISVSNGIDGCEIRYNELVNNFNLGIDLKTGARNCRIHHNTIIGQPKAAIYIDTNRRYVTDVKIYNNRITGGTADSNILLAREVWEKNVEPPPALERIRIYNNIVHDVPGDAIVLSVNPQDQVTRGTVEDIHVVNNTVANVGQRGIVIAHPLASGTVVRNNIVWSSGAVSYRFKTWNGQPVAVSAIHNISTDGSEGTMKADPEYVDGTSRDFRLRPESPAIDSGTDLDAPASDFDGTPRPQGFGWDIGSFEFAD